jgi:hypothetical protein
MFDETARQCTEKEQSFIELIQNKGIVPGIKVDQGLHYFVGTNEECWTAGLDSLDKRAAEYYSMGFIFSSKASDSRSGGAFSKLMNTPRRNSPCSKTLGFWLGMQPFASLTDSCRLWRRKCCRTAPTASKWLKWSPKKCLQVCLNSWTITKCSLKECYSNQTWYGLNR